VAGIEASLAGGGTVVLVPDRIAGPGDRPESRGKTQLAAAAAHALWQAGSVDLLVWAAAGSRAAILAGFAQAAADALGATPGRDCERAAARFTRWLGQTTHPWLVVLDNVADPADLNDLWPAGPAGRVLITTPLPAGSLARAGAVENRVGPFTPRQALVYLSRRLGAGPRKSAGVPELAEDLCYEPLALALASARRPVTEPVSSGHVSRSVA
jgi:hypothetical protein